MGQDSLSWQQAASIHAALMQNIASIAVDLLSIDILLLAQVSTTCRSVAAAVPLLLEGKAFRIWPQSGVQMPCLSSTLMLRWAPHVKRVFLSVQCTEYPGIKAFMAATSLKEANLRYPETYRREGSLIHSTPSTLYCFVGHNAVLHRQLWTEAKQLVSKEKLNVDLTLSEQLEAWLLLISGMPSLMQLYVHMNMLNQLLSTVVILSHVRLSVFMRTSKIEPMSLRWLRLQSSSSVTLHIDLSQQSTSQTQQAVRELQTLQIDNLYFWTWYAHFPAEVQQIWGQLESCGICHIFFKGHQGAVHALPPCRYAYISGPMSFPDQPVQGSFRVCWPDTTKCPGRVYITLHNSQELLVERCAKLSSQRQLTGPAAGIKCLLPSHAIHRSYVLERTSGEEG